MLQVHKDRRNDGTFVDDLCVDDSFGKVVYRNMAKPKAGDCMKIRRIVRFLNSVGEIKFLHAWQTEDEARDITARVDSDWAGNKETRKSTSGEGPSNCGSIELRSRAQPIYDGATRSWECRR